MTTDSRRAIIYTVLGAWALWGTAIVARALWPGLPDVPHLDVIVAFVGGSTGFVAMLVERIVSQASHEKRRDTEAQERLAELETRPR